MAPAWLREKAAMHTNEGSLIRVLSKRQRQNIRQVINKPLSLSFFAKNVMYRWGYLEIFLYFCTINFIARKSTTRKKEPFELLFEEKKAL